MIASTAIAIEHTTTPKTKPEQDKLGFGIYFTDHMFIMNYTAGQGWHSARVVPYQPIMLDPAAKVFHYGQTIFEGLKAYRTSDGRVQLFRPDANARRLNRSNERMSIPAIPEEMILDAIKTLTVVDQEWIPDGEGNSLYIRPYVIATEAQLGVHPSHEYQFLIIMSPVGAYYPEGINPVKIFVESRYVRAMIGGVGEAKTAGNYAASLKAQEAANEAGYTQVLWLDGAEHKYIEEVGSMNVFFKIDGTVYTPALNGSILDGITRNSTITMLKHWNIPVVERVLSIEEVFEAGKNGKLEEAFGTGTAAVISPIGELSWQGEKLVINNGATGTVSERLYTNLTGIQNGKIEDPFGWTVELK